MKELSESDVHLMNLSGFTAQFTEQCTGAGFSSLSIRAEFQTPKDISRMSLNFGVLDLLAGL